MGAIADGALSQKGKVIGVIPEFLRIKELAHEGLTELIIVESMHHRKLKMHELSDGVIAVPGGFGTLEEYFEILTWGQLGLHVKPVALLDLMGFYGGLLNLADKMVTTGFLKQSNRNMMLMSENLADLLRQMNAYCPETQSKWLSADRT